MKKNMTAKKRSDLGKTKKINGKPYILINIINSLPDAVALFNTKPELLHYNPAFTEFAAKSNKSSPRKKMKLTDFFTKKNAPQINNLMDETLKGKETKRVIEIKIKAGEKKYYELTLIPVLQKSKTDSVVLIVKDISKLKNESEELETLNERFKIVTKSANIGIWEYNFSDGTLYCNREMYNIFGKTSPDSNISDWISLIHPDDRKILAERYKNYVWTTKHTNEIESCCDYFEADFRIITGTDTIKHIASHTNIYRQQRGIYEKAVGACYDITMLKKNIEELRYAKNAAERAMAARSEFLTNISHEIRTPMNAIIGFTEMILASEQNEKNKNYLKTILSSGKTLLALINDILDFSKMESGKLELKPAAVCINDVISEIRNIFQESAQSKNLQFQVTTGKNLPEIIIIDDIRLRQILFNLISNAIKFTKSGYVRTGFEAKKMKQDTEFDLIISVEDTGTGIKSENIGKIFEPFYQENISGSCKT
ncbi:MAG: PAS domain S-box protein, partial [Ignavibacteria bacterium]|nr:PAS domain S-box protein [Ignavibacteria bacterium]